MWDATIDGRKLTFHLTGINNQNFIMQDEETNTWWQQVTGEAILGPLKGRRLKPIFHDELTFSVWKREQPEGRVLRPGDNAEWKDFSENWEEETAKMPVIARPGDDNVLPPRTIVIGLNINDAAKAYPLSALEKQSPIIDNLGRVPVIVVLGDDKKSVRAFETSLDGEKTEFFVKADAPSLTLVDARTGSEWDFTGRAVAGPLAGRELKKVPVLKDYWFDWKIYHPSTLVYTIGAQ